MSKGSKTNERRVLEKKYPLLKAVRLERGLNDMLRKPFTTKEQIEERRERIKQALDLVEVSA